MSCDRARFARRARVVYGEVAPFVQESRELLKQFDVAQTELASRSAVAGLPASNRYAIYAKLVSELLLGDASANSDGPCSCRRGQPSCHSYPLD
jgi:hypothetical protein